MKLVFYNINRYTPHHKNLAAIQRMCACKNIEYEMTDQIERLYKNDYDILISFFVYIPIEKIPPHVKIIYGPQFFSLFEIKNSPLLGKENPEFSKRAVYNSLSKWNRDVIYEFADELCIPCQDFPFSVDTEKFQPRTDIKKAVDCILYVKRRSKELVNSTIDLLRNMGLTYEVCYYGFYKEEDYIQKLHASKFMITLDAHESQGFALEEAMSCNIPLLVMDATTMYDEKDDFINSTYECFRPKNLYATSVPYWSDRCGIKITKQEELASAIENMLASYQTFTPRQYILEELSDSACMNRILDYFGLQTDIFLVTSVIHTGEVPWNYTPTRSLFTPEERFQQSLETIDSIRKYSPFAKILYVEGGKLESTQLEKIQTRCDYVHYLGEDQETKLHCIESNCKGMGDAWLISKGLQYIKENHIYGRNIYKLSGRYRVNENYTMNTISSKIPTFKKVNENSYITFFFSVPYTLLATFEKNITNVMNILRKNPFISIEDALPKSFTELHIVDQIGGEGIIAISPEKALYRV